MLASSADDGRNFVRFVLEQCVTVGWRKSCFTRSLWQQPCCEAGGRVQHGTKFPRFSLHSTVVHSNRQYRTCSKANPGSLNICICECCSFMLRQSCHTLQSRQCPPRARSNQGVLLWQCPFLQRAQDPNKLWEIAKSILRRSTRQKAASKSSSKLVS